LERNLKRRASVTMVETVNNASSNRQIPATYHSRVRSGLWLAISLSDRKRKITANTETTASMAFIIADCTRILILRIYMYLISFFPGIFIQVPGNGSDR
jgi:hypothetical protein